VREHPRAHGSHDPSDQLPAIADLIKAPIQEVHELALKQLRDMEISGAVIAEQIPVPVLIRSPIQPLAPMCVITTRWIGGGVFGAIFPLEDGTLLSGWVTIKASLRINPNLTPSGTMSEEPWDRDILSQKQHLLPTRAALRSAGHAAAQELAAQLLQDFPDRLTLNTTGDDSIDASTIGRRYIRAKRAMLERELNEAFALVSTQESGQRELQRFVIQTHADFFEAFIRKDALKIFQETRLDIVHISHDQDPSTSLLGVFVAAATNRATSLATPIVRELLRRNPLIPPPLNVLTRPTIAAIATTLSSNQSFGDLWSLLSVVDREAILDNISQSGRKMASYEYAQLN